MRSNNACWSNRDGKMSALDIRAYLRSNQHGYLSPLPLTGTTATQMPQWMSQGIAKAKNGELERVVKTNDKGQEVLVAPGYGVERTCRVKDAQGQRAWQKRVWSFMRRPTVSSKPKGWTNDSLTRRPRFAL